MAKLGARGRVCVVEATREYDSQTLQTAHDRYMLRLDPSYVVGSNAALTTWERTTRRLMSDGTVLEKRDVHFRRAEWEREDRRHSYGWKVHGKLKAGLTADDFARIYAEPSAKTGAPSKWTVTRGSFGPPAAIISQRRIVRAIESGEYIGFCTSCGHDQGGVEPDAEGYQCESCGQMSVKGAENLLMETAI